MYIVNIEQGMKFYYNRISSQWPQDKSKATDYRIGTYSPSSLIKHDLNNLKIKFPELHLEIEE